MVQQVLVIGPYIIIKNDLGFAHLYGDLEEITENFNVGDRVIKNQILSKEGNPSGTSSTGFHVHVEEEYLGESDTFLFGYNNSINPCSEMGIENIVSRVNNYIYYGDSPEPMRIKRKKFPWVIYTNKIRKRY